MLERDGYRCQFPDCSMRSHLEVHHVVFRSHRRDHRPANLITLRSIHHHLIHIRRCGVWGEAPGHLRWRRLYETLDSTPLSGPATEGELFTDDVHESVHTCARSHNEDDLQEVAVGVETARDRHD